MNESFLLLKEGNFSAFFLYTLISFAGAPHIGLGSGRLIREQHGNPGGDMSSQRLCYRGTAEMENGQPTEPCSFSIGNAPA